MADAAKQKVKFVGGSGDYKDAGYVHVPDHNVTLDRNVEAEVDAELAKELLAGEGRFKGLRVEAVQQNKPDKPQGQS